MIFFQISLTEVLDTLLGRYLLSCEKRKDHLWHKVSLSQQYVHSKILSISVDKKGQQLEVKKRVLERKEIVKTCVIYCVIYLLSNEQMVSSS